MLYKEWQIAKVKFTIWALIYLGAAGLFIWGRLRQLSYSEPFFQSWLGISILIMTIVAALGGVDIVSEEKASGTLSFLLTKPVNRTRIYLSKIMVNILALVAAFVPFNLCLLILDQINPTPVTIMEFLTKPCGENQWCSGWYEKGITFQSFDFLQALGLLGMILLFGVGIICLSGLISIFARNTIQAIFLTIPALIAFIVIVTNSITIPLGSDWRNSPVVGYTWSYTTISLSTLLILIISATLFFYIGLIAFRRKEF